MSLSKKIFHLFSRSLATKNLYITRSLDQSSTPKVLKPNYDYIRFATLELCYNEIVANNVAGNIAEVGVYKGDFAKRMNLLFSDRKLYLFDTFEGFSEEDVKVEQAKKYSSGTQDFSDTSVEGVLAKMPHKSNCIVKKGFFPSTAADVDDFFAFVSLDADLYQPILSGLNFFYPRLQKNGYIFIHDFNNSQYKGARDAVTSFCTENNIGYLPIPDGGGTVIITK